MVKIIRDYYTQNRCYTNNRNYKKNRWCFALHRLERGNDQRLEEEMEQPYHR